MVYVVNCHILNDESYFVDIKQWFPNGGELPPGGEFDTFQGGNGCVCNFLLFSILMHSLY